MNDITQSLQGAKQEVGKRNAQKKATEAQTSLETMHSRPSAIP